MQNSLTNRVLEEAKYILKNRTTIRKTALFFGLSKSTVHYDLARRLPKINGRIFRKVSSLLQFNFKVRYVRGGAATKRKFGALKQCLKEAV